MTKTPETLTNMEAERLLDELLMFSESNVDGRRAERNHCMALLMLDAGLRVGEVVRLLQTDLIISDEPVTALCVSAAISKSKRQRIIPLSIRVRASLKIMKSLWWTKPGSPLTMYAFYTEQQSYAISARQVQRTIKRAAIAALGRSVHPHVLRHTFASNLMRITNARVVQELLGHKQLSSTQVYCHPNQTDLTNAIGKLEKKAVNNSQNT